MVKINFQKFCGPTLTCSSALAYSIVSKIWYEFNSVNIWTVIIRHFKSYVSKIRHKNMETVKKGACIVRVLYVYF